MSKARQLADLLDASGDVAVGALDNVPPSNDASALTTGTLPVDRVPYVGRRNLIINGAMQVAQRGTSAFTVDGSFPADRFQFYHYGTGSCQRLQSSTPVADGFQNYVNFTSTATSNFGMFGQKVEGVSAYKGKTMTLSFYIKGPNINASGFTIWGGTYTDTGTFDDYIVGNGTPVTITSDWTRVIVTFTMPSTATNLGANGGYLYVFLRSNSNSESYSYNTTGWQLELGSVATPFEHRSYGEELALCQRYYWKSDSQKYFGIRYTGNSPYEVIPFPVSMRATPSVTNTWSVIWCSNGSLYNMPVHSTTKDSAAVYYWTDTVGVDFGANISISADAEL